MDTNIETQTVGDCRQKRTEVFSQASTDTSEKFEMTSRGIEMLHLLNDAFDNDLAD